VFSRRIPDDLTPNAVAAARARRGDVPFDLTLSNPTLAGVRYPPGLLAPLADEAAAVYRAEPLGLVSARRAVAEDYRRRGVEVDPGRIVLTASTSEAYALLIKLLCDPGDPVGVPLPSYPLLRHLVELEGARAVTYRLEAHAGWQPRAVPGGVRTCIAVHPNNPTGSLLSASAAQQVGRDVTWIVDEVFLDFPLRRGEAAQSFAGRRNLRSFCLGGLSKQIGLPQLKLAWIVVGGEDAWAAEALRRLEFIADQYLSVATPVQLALGELLRRGHAVRGEILSRCRRNLAALENALRSAPALTCDAPQAGWSAVLRYPAVVDEERLVLDLLERDGVAVQPGHWFGFDAEGFLVLSLLPEPAVFDGGVVRLLGRIGALVDA